jgi:general secretion pathway protein J
MRLRAGAGNAVLRPGQVIRPARHIDRPTARPAAHPTALPTLRPTPRPTGGFTLIEVLVALVVLGFVVIGLGQGVRFGLLAWNKATSTAGTRENFDAVDRTLRHLIEHTDPGNEIDPPRFTASSDKLDFISRLPDMSGMATNRVEAGLGVDSHHRLVLRWRPYLHAKRLRPPQYTETELLGGVARMELSFWAPGAGWTMTWDAAVLPAMVRIRLEFTDPAQRRWPDIVAAPDLDRP